jgi:hypothetical protein
MNNKELRRQCDCADPDSMKLALGQATLAIAGKEIPADQQIKLPEFVRVAR